MAGGQALMVFIVAIFLYLLVTVVLPPLIIVLINIALLYLAGKQALERWQSKTHYWYEMGLIFSFLIFMFTPKLLPFWPITNFVILAVAIAEFLQWVEKKTL